jgi:HAD superfamily hydrolase (TIGR01490 family)
MSALKAALFDMDRTLVRKDTATLFARYRRDTGRAPWHETLRVAWWMLQYSLGVIDAARTAELALRVFRGESDAELSDYCRPWFAEYVLPLVTRGGRDAVRRHREQGDLVALVTGTTAYAALPLARELGIEHVVCTELDVDGSGRLTGRIIPPLCFGMGKVERVARLARQSGFRLDEATVYTDSITDLPLLERAGVPVAVSPDARLRRVAYRRGWRIEAW